MTTKETKILVYSSTDTNTETLIGKLNIYSNLPEIEYSTFEYSNNWLNKPNAYSLGIDLPLKKGIFKCETPDVLFRTFFVSYLTYIIDFYYEIFLVYAKKNNLLSDKEGFNENELYQWLKTAGVRDAKFGRYYDNTFSCATNLLYQNDISRCGSLRFKIEGNEQFVQNLENITIPNIADIDRLIEILNKIKNNTETSEELELFHACVSGLNGRKPKTHVFNKAGDLCIAKLSCITDEMFSEYGVELLALNLASKFGIKTQEYSIEETKNGKNFLLIKRFDRKGSKRIPFLKLNAFVESDKVEDIPSIIKGIKDISKANFRKNANEFFKRSLFRIVITNTNAQIPNTGFLFNEAQGWLISPEYDLTCGYELKRTPWDMSRIEGFYTRDTRREIKELMKSRKKYGISKSVAQLQLARLKRVLTSYKRVALDVGFAKEDLYRIKIFTKCMKYIKIK